VEEQRGAIKKITRDERPKRKTNGPKFQKAKKKKKKERNETSPLPCPQ
jgi:hypothetical protein